MAEKLDFYYYHHYCHNKNPKLFDSYKLYGNNSIVIASNRVKNKHTNASPTKEKHSTHYTNFSYLINWNWLHVFSFIPQLLEQHRWQVSLSEARVNSLKERYEKNKTNRELQCKKNPSCYIATWSSGIKILSSHHNEFPLVFWPFS